MYNHKFGKRGEQRAKQYLESKGYVTVAENYRFKNAEIDLIAKKGGLLVFIEVKTRNSSDYGFPEEAVNNNKVIKIKEAADQFQIENNWKGLIRFDIIAIIWPDQQLIPEIEHFEDAFY